MPGRPHNRSVSWVGLRRICWVRITTGAEGRVRAEVAGLGHRRPVVRPVPLATAAALAAEGVPTVFRGLSSPSPGSSDGRLPLPTRH